MPEKAQGAPALGGSPLCVGVGWNGRCRGPRVNLVRYRVRVSRGRRGFPADAHFTPPPLPVACLECGGGLGEGGRQIRCRQENVGDSRSESPAHSPREWATNVVAARNGKGRSSSRAQVCPRRGGAGPVGACLAVRTPPA